VGKKRKEGTLTTEGNRANMGRAHSSIGKKEGRKNWWDRKSSGKKAYARYWEKKCLLLWPPNTSTKIEKKK